MIHSFKHSTMIQVIYFFAGGIEKTEMVDYASDWENKYPDCIGYEF